jgi:two-component system LytT family response regulator
MVLPASRGFNVFIINDIIWRETRGCFTKEITKEGRSSIVFRTLKVKYFRAHKSHLINLRQNKDYSKISGNYVTMSDGSKGEISRRKTLEFISKIKTI